MSVFARYALRQFTINLAILLAAFVATLQIFDLLANGADVVAGRDGKMLALLLYAGLRLPEIATQMFPFAVLMASLITLGRMERDREILAFKAAGGPYAAVLRAFLPAVLLAAAVHFLLADRLVPLAIERLVALDLIAEKPKRIAEVEPLFLQDGGDVVEARFVEAQGARIIGLRVYERDLEGRILGETYAQRAEFDAAAREWRLHDVWQARFPADAPATAGRLADGPWPTRLTPAEFSDLVEQPQGMRLEKLWRFAFAAQAGVRPSYFYQTWLHKRIALPVSTLLMILLAAPIASTLHRRDRGIGGGMAIGFLMGFIYFVTDGLVLALGESGALAPALAAWLPILLFASIGGIWLIRLEGY